MTTELAGPAIDVHLVPLEQLLESPMNVRRHYSPAAMQELEAEFKTAAAPPKAEKKSPVKAKGKKR